MRRQDVLLIEALAANLAREGPFARMNTLMSLEVGGLSETLLADFAFKRPFALVLPHMTIEVCHSAERLCADVAFEVLHSVYPLHLVRRLVSVALVLRRRTAGTAAERRVAVRLGYSYSFSLTDLNNNN